MNRGRPPKYKDEFAEHAQKLCLLGATDYELADFFKVDVVTIHRWRGAHEDFCKAVIAGKEMCDERVVRSLYNRAVGYTYESEKVFQFQGAIVRADTAEHVPPDPGAAMNWLKNRRPDEWREKQDIDLTTKGESLNVDDRTRAKAILAALRAGQTATVTGMIDLANVDIETRSVVSPEVTRRQVSSALARGLPDVAIGRTKTGALHIYANGPSARSAPLQWPCMALNGAMGLFRGEGPTYWAASDSQALVARFVRRAPLNPEFLVASRCHPDLFDALAGDDVTLWHVQDCAADLLVGKDQMPDAPSITLQAAFLAFYMGWREVVFHGWDGCYIDGKHHAVDQDHGHAVQHATVGGRQFMTTLAWLAEAEDVVRMLGMLPGLKVTVTGPGMIAAYLADVRK